MLTDAIYGFIYMTHGQIFQHRTCTAYQFRTFPHQASRHCCTCSCSNGGPIRHLQTTSLSVCSRSKDNWQACSNSGPKDSLYGQAIPESDPGASATCKENWENIKRNSHPGSGDLSPKWREAWLREAKFQNRSSLNIVLTDCLLKRLYRLISFWFRIRFGKQVLKAATSTNKV